MSAGRLLGDIWYRHRHPVALLLAPLGWLYALAAWLRRKAYGVGLLPSTRLPVPVLVVGNVAVGGTGKTPLVVWLAGYLASLGLRPAIVCRGYGGRAASWPQQVRGDSDPRLVGDEPVLIARRAGCPVVASGRRRVRAARALVEHTDCDVVISDDGLQHFGLARDIEVCVIDGVRRHGNGLCLPAGPLREPASRLRSVDLVVCNGIARRGEFAMSLVPGPAVSVASPADRRPLASFAGSTVHAVCGIGNPRRFFDMLLGQGIAAIEHPFEDHHPFTAEDLDFGDGAPVLMTEKDAVKCERFARPGLWYVPVTAELPEAFCTRVERALAALGTTRGSAD